MAKPLVPQPHLIFDDRKMWKLSHLRGHTLQSPLTLFRAMSPAERGKAAAEYRKGYTITDCA